MCSSDLLEDVCDNLFNPDPYLQQGGDMVRVAGLKYALDPKQKMGSRINNLQLRGRALEPCKTYRLASWAPVAEGSTGDAVWDLVGTYLRHAKLPDRR